MIFIRKLLEKAFPYIIGLLLVYSATITTLYYHSNTNLIEAQVKLQQATEALNSCTKDKKKLEESGQVTDEVIVEQQGKLQDLEKTKQDLLEQLASLPRKDCNNSEQEGSDNETDIGAALPSDLQRLLQQSYDNSKRKTNISR